MSWLGCVCGALLCTVPGMAAADCIDDAAAFQHVNVTLMRAIAQVESGTQADSVNLNTNGTVDIGLMQINSFWLPTLSREGISRQSLFDSCTNAYVGAWILAANIKQFGPTWRAIGAYNATTDDKRLAYAKKIYTMAQAITGSPGSTMPILPPSFTPPQQYDPFSALNVSSVQVGRARAGIANAPGGGAGDSQATPSTNISQASPGAYNFNWTVTGADEAKPIQVFDDGKKVYVQFTDMKHVPAIFAETPNGRALLHWDLQFPYAVIARPEKVLLFQMGTLEAKAQRMAVIGPQAGAGAAKAGAAAPASGTSRAASADALWYVTLPSAARAATTPAKVAPAVAPHLDARPAASAPATTTAPQAAKPSVASSVSDALWYVTKPTRSQGN
jgi:hypothetical protein